MKRKGHNKCINSIIKSNLLFFERSKILHECCNQATRNKNVFLAIGMKSILVWTIHQEFITALAKDTGKLWLLLGQGKRSFSFFCTCHTACRILVPQQGIEPTTPAVETHSLNHWTAREVPRPFSRHHLKKQLWANSCSPQTSYVEVLTPAPQNVFGDRVFKKVIKVT